MFFSSPKSGLSESNLISGTGTAELMSPQELPTPVRMILKRSPSPLSSLRLPSFPSLSCKISILFLQWWEMFDRAIPWPNFRIYSLLITVVALINVLGRLTGKLMKLM